MIGNLKKRIRNFIAATRGNALLELGFAAPIIAIVLTGLLDIGSMAYDTMSLQNAARVGAQYGMKHPTDTAGITQAVTSATGLKADNLTVTTNNFCECGDGSSVTCGGVCADSGPNRGFVSVAVQQSYKPLLPYPGLEGQIALSGQSVFRVQ